jgi:hypothetical protein
MRETIESVRVKPLLTLLILRITDSEGGHNHGHLNVSSLFIRSDFLVPVEGTLSDRFASI